MSEQLDAVEADRALKAKHEAGLPAPGAGHRTGRSLCMSQRGVPTTGGGRGGLAVPRSRTPPRQCGYGDPNHRPTG